MLKIRLSRWGKNKSAFFRIVLTENTKPVKCGYKEVLGWFDPINHKMEINLEKTKEFINKWAQPSERVAKLIYKNSNDEFFKKFYNEVERIRKTKKQEEAA